MRAAVFHDPDAADEPAGLVGRHLIAEGFDLVPVVRSTDLAPPTDVDLSIHMGSDALPSDPAAAPLVDPERQAMRAALDRGTPVLGICFGAQLLADVLGGTTMAAPVAEYGMHTVESTHELCPPGPWVQAHRHTFTVPAGTVELGRSAAGPQGLLWEGTAPAGQHSRALGWQFHPEVTPSTIRRWKQRSASWADIADDTLAQLLDEESGCAERSGRLIAAGIAWLRNGDSG